MNTTFVIPDLIPVLPEIFLMSMACLILVIDLFIPQQRRDLTHWMTTQNG